MVVSVLILGSGPSVLAAQEWSEKPFDKIVAINNAWQVRPDWDDLIYPYDFPKVKVPKVLHPSQSLITEREFVPVQNSYGGFVYAGGTMAYTAAYWALGHYQPEHISFLGCDMVYAGEQTHFYGKGEADPLREDVTLMSLEAKANRFYVFARLQDCMVTNLSRSRSRLTFPRYDLKNSVPCPMRINHEMTEQARQKEKDLGYVVPDGRYWEDAHRFERVELANLDALWLDAVEIAS